MSLNVLKFFSSALLILSGALAACGGSDGALGEQPTITGQISGWSRGAGFILQASVVKATPSVMSMVIASAPIDAAGNFRIALPGSATVGPLLTTQHIESVPASGQCKGSIQVDPPDVAGVAASFFAVKDTTTLGVSLRAEASETAKITFSQALFL